VSTKKKTSAPSIDGTPAAEILRRLEISVTRRLDGLLQGDHRGLTPGHGSEPGEIRAYQPGDDVRRIDWNVTARLGDTHVRDSVADRELETWILIDASASLAFGTATCEKRDLALAGAAATGFLTARTGNRIGGMTIGPDGASPPIPARSGRVHMQALLRQMLNALDSPQPGRTDLSSGLRRIASTAKRRGLIVVISDFLDPGPWDAALRSLSLRHDVLCIEVLDPVELNLPDVGMLLLHDTVTGREIEVPTGNAKFRERYAKAASDQRATIAHRIRATSADHLVLRTDRDWLLDLARFVSRRRDRIDSLSRSAAHGSGNVGAIPGATFTTGAIR
jgi:uncharacterized protein (DUF58 family)